MAPEEQVTKLLTLGTTAAKFIEVQHHAIPLLLGGYKPSCHRRIPINVPDGIDARGKWLGLHENASRCRLEIKAQGRAEPAFHLFTGDDALVPVAEDLRG